MSFLPLTFGLLPEMHLLHQLLFFFEVDHNLSCILREENGEMEQQR